MSALLIAAPGFAAAAETAAPEQRALSFVGDVLPVLSKAGCAASGCHSSPEGQNGFKLSVFSYDPRSDHEEIVSDLRGRRVFPAAAEHSLLLRKATHSVPHEGGQRIAGDSPEYRTIARWIEQGMAYQLPDEPELDGIEIEPALYRAGRNQGGNFAVVANFSDGSRRDVTALCAFESTKPELVEVDEDGVFRLGKNPGEGSVVARYMGEVAVASLGVPPDALLPDTVYAGLPRHNFIDELAIGQWRRLGLEPSAGCSDAVFLRRASLSLIGTLPTAQRARAFLNDKAPDKRRKLIDELLEDPAWADHWAIIWVDLLRPNPDRVGVKSVYVLDQWIRERFRADTPYDQFAREVLTATGSTHRDGPTVPYRDRRTPADLATSMSQIFMGVRLECARCHNHPNDKWSQRDFYQVAAYFGRLKRKGTGVSPPISGSPEFFFNGESGSVTHPVSGAAMTPTPPDGEPVRIADGQDTRAALADWLTESDNPFFARALVNRVWAAMLGRGFVTPVDDFRSSNPPSNPALLDALARDFIEHGYDLKHLMRRIASSHLFALSSEPNASNTMDIEQFTRAYRRRLPAEVLTDAVAAATGVPDSFEGMPRGARAIETWNFKISSDILDAFGRPDSSEDCPCERNLSTSVVQALYMMNSGMLHSKITHPEGRAARLTGGEFSPREIGAELMLAAWSRLPTEQELRVIDELFAAPDADRKELTEDILWALLNSAEFMFNH